MRSRSSTCPLLIAGRIPHCWWYRSRNSFPRYFPPPQDAWWQLAKMHSSQTGSRTYYLGMPMKRGTYRRDKFYHPDKIFRILQRFHVRSVNPANWKYFYTPLFPLERTSVHMSRLEVGLRDHGALRRTTSGLSGAAMNWETLETIHIPGRTRPF
jgi:hypothetical protein